MWAAEGLSAAHIFVGMTDIDGEVVHHYFR